MNITNLVIPLFFISIILKQLRYMKELIIPTRKSYVEILTILFAVIILMCIMYFYANIWIHYVTGILGIFMFISMWLKEGINSKGFISMYRYKDIILWNEIEKVIIISSKNVKIKVSGGFMQQTFNFKKSDYDNIITILKENLPNQAHLQTTFNK